MNSDGIYKPLVMFLKHLKHSPGACRYTISLDSEDVVLDGVVPPIAIRDKIFIHYPTFFAP